MTDSHILFVSDITSLPVQTIIIKAGENKSLACPGVNEHSLISALEWLSFTHRIKLVEFTTDTTTVWVNQHRISMLPDTYGLYFHPAMGEDSGEYICLVNSRPKPDAIVKLIVQGKIFKYLLSDLRCECLRDAMNLQRFFKELKVSSDEVRT